MATRFIETFESRMMLSVTAMTTPALNAGVLKADVAKIEMDYKKLRSDEKLEDGILHGDFAKLRLDLTPAEKGQLAPLFKKLAGERAARKAFFVAGKLDLALVASEDKALIRADVKAIIADKGNPAKEKIDHAKLKADASKLLKDVVSLRRSLKKNLEAVDDAIKADREAIYTALKGDANLAGDLAKIKKDRAAAQQILAADKAVLAADFAKLVKDQTMA